MDSGDKASNKAMAIAFKYACFQVFCIPTEEMKDPDAETPEPSAPKPSAPAMFTCEECSAVLKPYMSKGKEIGVRQHAAASHAKFGKALCIDCIKKNESKTT